MGKPEQKTLVAENESTQNGTQLGQLSE